MKIFIDYFYFNWGLIGLLLYTMYAFVINDVNKLRFYLSVSK